MRVGYDARPVVFRWTGMRTYTVNLVYHLAQISPSFEGWLYYRTGRPDTELARLDGVRWRHVPALTGWWWTLLTIPAVLRWDGIDLFHAEYIVPPLSSCPTVVTVHDAISAMFLEPTDLKTRVITNTLTFLSVHRSPFVLVPSESTRRDIRRIFKVPARKLVITPYGVSGQFRPFPKGEAKRWVAEEFGIKGRFILTVNFFRPRKNAPVLAAAFRELCRRKIPVDHLVFVGTAPEEKKRHILRAAGEVAERVIFTGYIPDEALPIFYSAADVFAFPSRYEGFGLPVLEAMACGTPVVAGDAPAVNEIASDAALLVRPDDWRGLADALEKLLTEEGMAQELARRGLRRAANFTWERTARLTLTIYERVSRQL